MTTSTNPIDRMAASRQAATIAALRDQGLKVDEIAAKLQLPRELVRAVAHPPRYK